LSFTGGFKVSSENEKLNVDWSRPTTLSWRMEASGATNNSIF